MAYSLSPRENYLLALEHKPTEFIPIGSVHSTYIGYMDSFEKGPPGGGLDGFGVNWVYSGHTGMSGPVPEPNNFILEDVTEWEKTISFPNVEAIDWEAKAQADLAPYNREMVTIDYASGNAPFERLAALMGFEGALMAMATDPEATYDLLSAITDYKIAVMKKVAQYYKADTFTYHDDIATVSNLFMSPDTYRKLIKPQHKRLNDACWNEGIMPIQHTCGKADICIDDYVDAGPAAWSLVQSTNDIVGILTRYKGRFTLMGGYDWQGPPGQPSATQEERDAEVMRMLRQYAHLDGFIGSYMSFAAIPSDPNGPAMSPQELMAARQVSMKHTVDIIQEFEATEWKKNRSMA